MSTPTDKTPTPVTCRSCGYSGLIDTYDPCLSVYADCRCPQCGSTDNQHNDDYNDSLQADVEESHRRPQTMSAPTPRTDAVVAPYVGQDGVSVEECDRLLDHARQLERELEEARVSEQLNLSMYQAVNSECAKAKADRAKAESDLSLSATRTYTLQSQLHAHKAALVKAREALKTCTEEFVCMDINNEFHQRDHDHEKVEEALTTINEALNDGPLPAPNKEQSNHK